MSKRRHTVDTITDDALDKLYQNANRGWRRGDAWKGKATAALASLDGVLRIVADWVTEANDFGGIDADDLAWRLEEAGHKLPEGDE